VTGALGGAAGGLKLLFDGLRLGGPVKSAENRAENLILKQLRPSPETDTGRQLGAERLATAMIDLSDGLSGDLRHLCRAGAVGARIFADRIPVDPDLDGLPVSDGQRFDLALHGGEDFRLLLTVDPKIFFERRNFFEKHDFFEIGEVIANAEMIEVISEDRTSVLEPKSFLHF
jgi:thiamine-monophosphate kinase